MSVIKLRIDGLCANLTRCPKKYQTQSRKPMQNSFIERFNRSYREAVLDMYIFETLEDVKTETEKWLGVYNQYRPHEGLGNLTPIEYLQKFNQETVI